MAGDLRRAFDESVTASSHLIEGVDAAIIAAGRRLADQIDYAADNLSGQDLTKALYLTPHLMNVLREMGATPAAREGMTEGASGGGTNALGKLRLAHGTRGA